MLSNTGAVSVDAIAAASATGESGDADGEDADAYGFEFDDVGDVDVNDIGAGSTVDVQSELSNSGELTVTAIAMGEATGEGGDASGEDAQAYGFELDDINDDVDIDDVVGEGASVTVSGELINTGALTVTAMATGSASGADGDASGEDADA